MPVPPLEGEITRHHDGRCRTWTVEHIPFDELPAFEPGMRSPVMVALYGWRLIWHSGDTLSAYQPDTQEQHELHGQTGYPTEHDAYRAWYNAGLMGFWVYENVAGQYGLPSTMSWTRSQPDFDTTSCGAEERRIGGARTAMWWRILDPGRDLTVDRWQGLEAGEDLYGVFVVSAYGAAPADIDTENVVFVEIEYGIVVCVDPNDPGPTEVTSRYVYEHVAGTADASTEALDGYLAADVDATFQELGAAGGMHDYVWNSIAEQHDLQLRAYTEVLAPWRTR